MLLFLHALSSMSECYCEIINLDFVRELDISQRSDGDIMVQVTYIYKTKEESDPENVSLKEYTISKKEDKFYFLDQLKNLGLR